MRYVLSLLGLLWAVSGLAGPHPFNVHDLLATKRVGAPVMSPDGRHVLFSVKTVDETSNASDSDLWVLELATGDVRQLTHTPRGEGNYQWAGDSEVVFSRDRNIWKQPLQGDKAQKIFTAPVDIETFRLAPDGRHVLFSARVHVDCPSLDCTAKRNEATKQRAASGRLYDRLFVRHWDTWEDGKRSHLWYASLDGSEARDLMAGLDADVPAPPFGGSEDYRFSPDGKSVFFSAKVAGKEEAWSTNFDIYRVDLEDTLAKPLNLTADNAAWDAQPVPGPKGQYLYYLAMRVPGYESDRFRLMRLDLSSGKREEVVPEWDRSVASFAVSDDGSALLATALDRGQRKLFHIDLATGKRRVLQSKGKVGAFALHGSTVVFAHNTFSSPTELYRQSILRGKARQLTYFNQPLMAQVQMGDYEQFRFRGWNDEWVYGYVFKPVGFRKKRHYPVALLIHGGPQGSFYNQFHYRWNPQIFAAAGYVTVIVDFHGSTGYGQAFTDSIQGDWGGKPLEDLQKAMAHVKRKYPFADTENSCALGASYGGYMINWIAGQWPAAFKCLVNHDGVFDNRMMYYATEELWFPEREHLGPYHDFVREHEKHNPVNYVKRWRTPMLVIQGGRDYRIPESQALGTFTALQRQGIESRFLYFPDENHWVLKPANTVLWHDTVLAWLNRFLGSGKGK
jgi:dipeptidyl aminopeptidase/acylaminoacyl peptidase